jgi:hypothetical protein
MSTASTSRANTSPSSDTVTSYMPGSASRGGLQVITPGDTYCPAQPLFMAPEVARGNRPPPKKQTAEDLATVRQ